MNRRIKNLFGKNYTYNYIAFLVCAAFFLCGGIVGAFSSASITDTDYAFDFLFGYLKLAEDDLVSNPGFLSVMINTLKFPLIALFLGFSVFGVIGLPILSAVRGFLLAFSASLICRLFGTGGIWLAFALYGLSALMTVPCFFVLSSQCFSSSGYLLQAVLHPSQRTTISPFNRTFLKRCVICFIILLAVALLETLFSPGLIKLAAGHI